MIRARAVFALFAVCVVAPPRGGAEEAPASYSRRVWQKADGLPEDLAQALAQTPDGYLWIGTSGGLVRFDGVRFALFNRDVEPAFREDSVYALLAARDGTLWAGTEGGGLIRYRAGVFRSFGAAEGLSNGFVRVVFEDRAGQLWVGTDDGLFQRQGDTLTRVDGRGDIPEINVHSICEDRQGRLLIGGAGLLVLDEGRAAYYRSAENLADDSIRTLLETADGAVWIGTISGLRRLPRGLQGDPFAAPRMIDGVNTAVLRQGRMGELWIGSYGRGVLRLQDGRQVALRAPRALPHDNVLAIFEDREGNVWVGTQGGLLRMIPSAAATVTAADGAPLSINTVYQDPRGPLLVSALDGRLFQVSGPKLVPLPLPAAVARLPIRNVLRDRSGRLWVGTDGQGVATLRGAEVTRYTMQNGLVNDFVRAFSEDALGGMWIGTDGGISYLRGGAFSNFSSQAGLAYHSIRSLLLDRDGSLWIATDGGLSRFRAGSFVDDPLLKALQGKKVWALFEDAEDGLWIGTQGDGLFLLKGGELRQFTTRQGLPSDKVHFITEDQRGRLWLTGPAGIVSVARQGLEALPRGASSELAVRVYGTPEGLSTSQMNGGVQPAGAVTPAGELWFPSTRGAVRIVPDVPDREIPASVLIEQVIADERPVASTAELVLPPGEGKLEIQYTSVRLGSPEKVRFRYWMEDFDHGWTAAGQRRVAYYTNLPPGRYRFHVAAYEIEAPHKVAEQVLDIHWKPHFHQTSWFAGLCALAVAACGWGAYRLHVRRIRRQFSAVLDERSRLAREMHDTLIQGCVGVSALLEAASHAQEVSPNLTTDLLDRARAEVRAAVDEARLAVWNLRRGPEQGNGDGDAFVPAVSRLAHRISVETGIAVRFQSEGTPLHLGAETEWSLMMLIREALQNAIRHATPKNLSVGLRFDRRRLHVHIEDDGCGFDSTASPPGREDHYGLIGMRERVEKLGGRFELTSSRGRGTQVRLTIAAGGRLLGRLP